MADALLAATIPPSKILGGNWGFFFNFPLYGSYRGTDS